MAEGVDASTWGRQGQCGTLVGPQAQCLLGATLTNLPLAGWLLGLISLVLVTVKLFTSEGDKLCLGCQTSQASARDTQEIPCNWIRQTAPGKLNLKPSKANMSTFPPILLYGGRSPGLEAAGEKREEEEENRAAVLYLASEALHQAALPSHPPSSAISVLPFEFRQS